MIQPSNFNRIALGALLLISAFFLTLPSTAEAKNGGFDFGVSVGYTWSTALSPSDGNTTPKVKSDGHGFAVTISPGTRFNDYVGLYVDFGLNVAWMQKDAQIGDINEDMIAIHEKDYLYAFTTMLMVRFFQPVYKGEIFEAIGLGYSYTGDTFIGKEPGSTFAAKASLGYLFVISPNFRIGVVGNTQANHRTDSKYFNFTVDAQVQTFLSF
ncbi:MAG: outer membrane beta-barrel protein [Proteobacteria bacterium]|nr:outer membrane beta-barrel protein [Pseudomonadota bacterium]